MANKLAIRLKASFDIQIFYLKKNHKGNTKLSHFI